MKDLEAWYSIVRSDAHSGMIKKVMISSSFSYLGERFFAVIKNAFISRVLMISFIKAPPKQLIIRREKFSRVSSLNFICIYTSDSNWLAIRKCRLDHQSDSLDSFEKLRRRTRESQPRADEHFRWNCAQQNVFHLLDTFGGVGSVFDKKMSGRAGFILLVTRGIYGGYTRFHSVQQVSYDLTAI